MKLLLKIQILIVFPGLSLSFEAGVTPKISAVTYEHMGEGHVNEGPKGLGF